MSAPSPTSSATSASASAARARRVLLVGGAVALQAGVHRLPERPVEAGRVLRRVREDAGVDVPGRVERLPDRTHLAVHHPARAEQVRPGLGLRERHRGVAEQRRVVVDAGARLVQHAAVPVVGELVQAQVGHQDRGVADLADEVAQGHVEHAVGVIGPGAARVLLLVLGHAEDHQPAHAVLDRVDRRLDQRFLRVLDDAGHAADRHRLADALADEHRQHEIARAHLHLADQPAQRGRAAQPARARRRERRQAGQTHSPSVVRRPAASANAPRLPSAARSLAPNPPLAQTSPP